MPTIIEQTVYTYDELSDSAKETVRQWWSETLDNWHEFCYEDFKEVGKILGITMEDIYFSGFWSQGDGACFVGHYSCGDDPVNEIKRYAPKDEELHRIAEGLTAIQMECKLKHGGFMSYKITHTGHYYHENSVTFEGFDDFDEVEEVEPYDDGITELLRDLMKWMYKRLEEEYEYQTSDENVAEACEANEYKFYESGEFYG